MIVGTATGLLRALEHLVKELVILCIVTSKPSPNAYKAVREKRDVWSLLTSRWTTQPWL